MLPNRPSEWICCNPHGEGSSYLAGAVGGDPTMIGGWMSAVGQQSFDLTVIMARRCVDVRTGRLSDSCASQQYGAFWDRARHSELLPALREVVLPA